MKPERFLLASTNGEHERPTYILHTQFPKALIQIVHTSANDGEGKLYSYMLQNEVQPRYLKFVVQPYDKGDYTNMLDEAWLWLNETEALAA
jgi:hypothetical protein